jgi:energy-coupling factor transport system ATP-binding protein
LILIKYTDFCFRYGNEPYQALKNINLNIEAGEFVLVSGPSGGGKSSFCRCLNGLIPHFYGGHVSGDVTVNGSSILKHSTQELARMVGMTFQDPENQLTAMDVEREIVFGMENLGFTKKLMSKRLEESLDTIGISALRHRVITELSGGEKQKVAIAAVLALHPKVLVMDEPTSELDPKGAEDVLSVVQRLNDELGLTVILVEHRLERVIHLVDRIILIHQGEVIADGLPRQVLSDINIQNIGVGIPPLIRLANQLNLKGKKIESVPLTVKEGRAVFGPLLSSPFSDHRLPHNGRTNGDGTTVLSVNNAWYTYSNQTKAAVKNISLEFHKGELTAIMGRNASGKSTLLKMFNGILKPVRGKILVNGIDTRHIRVAQLANQVGLVFQNPDDHLFADTVENEIGLTLKNLAWDAGRIRNRVEGLLKAFDLERYRDRYPRYLSGGEKQRVALAATIASSPPILALDEPTRGMDYKSKTYLMRFLNAYCATGNTVVLVSHDVETIAEHAQRVILMSEGQIIIDDTKEEVLSEALLFSPQINRLVQAFNEKGVPRDILTVDEMLEILK